MSSFMLSSRVHCARSLNMLWTLVPSLVFLRFSHRAESLEPSKMPEVGTLLHDSSPAPPSAASAATGVGWEFAFSVV